MALAALRPPPKFKAFDGNGNLLTGGKLYTYSAGTTTALATYTTPAGTVANANPVILDSNGEADVYFQPVNYKLALRDANDNLIWTADDYAGSPYPITDEWITYVHTWTLVSANQVSVPGDQTAIYQVNRAIRAVCTGGTFYGVITGSTYDGSTKTTLTVSFDVGSFDSGINGSSTLSIGVQSNQSPALVFAQTAINAPGTSATSTTNLTIGAGGKSLTVQSGKSIVVGMSVKIAVTIDPVNWMHGDVVSYDSATGALVVNVTATNGAGTAAAWTVSLSGPITDQLEAAASTSSSNVTLTADSTYIQTITPADCGASFFLPIATTLSVSRSNFLLCNDSEFPVAVRDSTGVLRFSLLPQSSVTVTCKDKSTAAGQWVFDREGAPGMPTVAKRIDGYIVPTHQPHHASAAILSSTLATYLINNASGHLYIVAANPTTGEAGTPFLIEAVSSINGDCEVHAVTATTALVKWKSGSTLKAVVVTFTTATATPSLGGVASLSWSGVRLGANNPRTVAVLSSTLHVLASENGSTDIQAAAVSVSGSSVSITAALVSVVTGFGATVGAVRVASIDATRFAVWGSDSGSASTRIAAASVSGVAITPGGTITINAGVVSPDSEVVVCSATQLAAMAWNGDVNYHFYALALSSVTLNASSSAALGSNVTTGTSAGHSLYRTGYALSATEILFNYQYSSSIRQTILTVNGSATPSNPISSSTDYSSAVASATEPATDYWPTLFYSNSSTSQSRFPMYTRSGGTIMEIGLASIRADVLEDYRSCKLSGAYTWLFVSHVAVSPRAFVIKKVGTSLQSVGEIPLAVGHTTLKSAFVQSGQKIAFLSSVGLSVPVLNCFELVS